MRDVPTAPPGPPPFPDMVWIPGGTFRMGSDKHYPEERPVHRVRVDGFWMDRYPVTNARFARFADATDMRTFPELPPDPPSYPGALRSRGDTTSCPVIATWPTRGRETFRGNTAAGTARSVPRRSAAFRPTATAFTTRLATCGNGPPTGTAPLIRATRSRRVVSRTIRPGREWRTASIRRRRRCESRERH
jgi:hypothetical protein